MPKKLNITAKIAPDVLLQEFKSKEFYFFALKISLFRKYVSYFKYRFDTPESLTNKGIKEKPIEMSYHKGSDFNRFFTHKGDIHHMCSKVFFAISEILTIS